MPSPARRICRKSAANKAVDAVFESITDALKGGSEVRLVGFGTFSVASRAASEGRNPRTGEKITDRRVEAGEVQARQAPARRTQRLIAATAAVSATSERDSGD